MHTWLAGNGSRRSAVAAVGVLTALAAGCSSSATSAPPPPTPRQVIQLAASNVSTVHSFTATINIRLNMTGTATGTQSTTMGGTMTEQMHPSLFFKADFTTFDVAGQSLPGGVTEILTPNEIYMKFAQLSQELKTSKPWIGMPMSALSASSGVNFKSLINQMDTSSPLSQARLLVGAKNVKAVGTGTVAGVPVTEYTGTYSMATALAKLPASLRSSLGSAYKQSGLNSGTVAFQVWIDGKHIFRKETVTITTSKITEVVSYTMTSINPTVTATTPPASQVYNLSAAQLGAGG